MSKLHAQMALFAALDKAVIHEPSLAKRVEEALPKTTGKGQRGWSNELLDFMKAIQTDSQLVGLPDLTAEPVKFPEAPQAFEELIAVEDDEPDAPKLLPDDDANALQAARPENPGVAGRALFALDVLNQIEQLPPVPKSGWKPITAPPAAGPDALDLFLTLTRPQPGAQQGLPPDAIPNMEADATDLANSLRKKDSRTRSDFPNLMERFSGTGIDEDVARTRPCMGRLRKIKGGYCTVLTTDAKRPDVPIELIKRVIDPWNWTLLSPFFCVMEERDSYRGWSKVRENVSTDQTKYMMDTELKYWCDVTRIGGEDTELYLNYDLAEHRSDLGLVEVDNGYIWVTKYGTGVRIRTGKQVRICGLSPTATAALACFAGWADAGNQMLCTRVLELAKAKNKKLPPFNKIKKLTPFKKSPNTRTAKNEGLPRERNDVITVLSPRLADGFRGEVLKDAACHVNQFLDGANGLADNVKTRWLKGIDEKDIEPITTNVGDLLKETALASWQTAMRHYKPKEVPKPQPAEGGPGA